MKVADLLKIQLLLRIRVHLVHLAVLTGITYAETVVGFLHSPCTNRFGAGMSKQYFLSMQGTFLSLRRLTTVQTGVIPRRTHGVCFWIGTRAD